MEAKNTRIQLTHAIEAQEKDFEKLSLSSSSPPHWTTSSEYFKNWKKIMRD